MCPCRGFETLWICKPTAHAVGYYLTLLRSLIVNV